MTKTTVGGDYDSRHRGDPPFYPANSKVTPRSGDTPSGKTAGAIDTATAERQAREAAWRAANPGKAAFAAGVRKERAAGGGQQIGGGKRTDPLDRGSRDILRETDAD